MTKTIVQDARTIIFGLVLLVFLGSTATAALIAPYRADALDRLETSSFHVLLPAELPTGARLVLTDVRRNSDGSTDVDIFYELPGLGRLHLWQTDRSPSALGTKNPLQRSAPILRGSLTDWLQGDGFSGRVVTLDGRVGAVIVSIDAPITATELLIVADSLR